jgi:hypothetical protein
MSTNADEATSAEAWQLAQASRSAKLDAALRHAPPPPYGRFAAHRDLLVLSRARRRKLLHGMGLSLAGAALTFTLATGHVPAARAAGISVGGGCTLADAITAANTDTATGGCTAGSGADTITLSGDVILTRVNNTTSGGNGLPLITSTITIEGAGFAIARDLSAPDFRILYVEASGNLTLNDTTVTGGVLVPYLGGGIYNNGGTVTISNSTISGNSAADGGGIFNYGTVMISNSTISGNSASFSSGGLYSSGTALISNSTIIGNTASSSGGGVTCDVGGVVTLVRSLIAGNAAPVGAEVSRIWVIRQRPSIINAANFNLFGHSGTSNAQAFESFMPSGSDISATSDGNNPTRLAAILNTTLANNGGPTFTHALVAGSPALDAVQDGPTTDQRGVSRPQGTGFDIGAFELEQLVPTSTPTDTPTSTPTVTPPALSSQAYLPGIVKP